MQPAQKMGLLIGELFRGIMGNRLDCLSETASPKRDYRQMVRRYAVWANYAIKNGFICPKYGKILQFGQIKAFLTHIIHQILIIGISCSILNFSKLFSAVNVFALKSFTLLNILYLCN